MSKPFAEFLKTIDEARLTDWVEAANELGLTLEFPVTPENVNSFIAAITAANIRIFLRALREYHEWLHG